RRPLCRFRRRVDWQERDAGRHDPAKARPPVRRASAHCQRPAVPLRTEATTMSDVSPPNPEEVLRVPLPPAAQRRRQGEEGRRLQQERRRPYQELRPRWERAWDAAYLWPEEQNRCGRKPDPQGFEEWAGLWVELGEVLNAFNRIESDREEDYRAMAGS